MEKGAVSAPPRTASIVISCYNYGQYVAAAIESALGQSHAAEVIVVDDGSTDDSPAVIARYAHRVRVETKANGGQASVFNVGGRLATGEAVLLLDADDELRPAAVETILALWRPEAVLVQWRLSLMNVEGDDIDGTVPPPWIQLDEGDVRGRLLATGSFGVTVTSGLAARRDVLLRILPMPEPEFRLGADGFVVRAMGFLGPVQAVDRPLSRYRLHSANEIGGSPARIAATCRKYIGWAGREFDAVSSLARQHGLTPKANIRERNADYLRYRLYSLVTEPEAHPLRGDTRAQLLSGLVRAQTRLRTPLALRLQTLLLDVLVAVLPRAIGRRLLASWYRLKEISRRSATARSRSGWLARMLVSETIRNWSAGPDSLATALARDTRIALRNAAKLAISLVGTWSVGIVVRFWLPRHLGPQGFGLLSFAEGLASTALGCASLGIDTYVQKEIPIRPHTASDFYGGTVVLRSLLSAALIVGLLSVPLGARSPELPLLLLIFGVGHFALTLNASLAVLLQANATVDDLARINVFAKIAWGLGMAACIVFHLPLVGFAAVFAASETLKGLLLQRVARRRLGLQFRVNAAATRAAVTASLGFYALHLTQVIGWRLDVTLLGFLAHDADVGWYGASQTLASIILLLTPVLGAVLMPLLSRAHARSPEEMVGTLRRALEATISVSTPVALLLALGAELWVTTAFGMAFAPAAGSLRMLTPLFPLIYVSILLSAALLVQDRGWKLSIIALVGLTAHAFGGVLLVPALAQQLGPGGAGVGMALAAVLKEVIILCLMLASLGSGIIDRKRWTVLLRTALAVIGTVAVHLALGPLGPWRLLADCVVYPALAIGLGAVDPGALRALARALTTDQE